MPQGRKRWVNDIKQCRSTGIVSHGTRGTSHLMSKRNCHGIKKQSSEKVTATKVKSLHLPFSWPSKPGTPIATPGIFLVMSCLHKSEVNRMSFEKKEKRCYQRLRK
ncbi:hypothetical protein P5673_002897 [Acropora cervicornis]|uniref:Uncharacterized protein n=1 Tax=Acropora cervicornis TaxID=6130 RepID=A0AAD9R3Y2_ACRCE|nr:hypothetical protein P5673_002897 [Acropora cervicornis]